MVATTTTTTMIELTLLSWLSPVFPTGGYAYSGGLEAAVAEGRVHDAETLARRIATVVGQGALWNDVVLAMAAWRGQDVTDLAIALAGSAERLRETVDQGRAFRAAAVYWATVPDLQGDVPFPVALGAFSAAAGIAPLSMCATFLHAWASAQAQAAIRLSVTGQDGAARVLAGLQPVIAETAARAADSDLDALGGFAPGPEIDSLRHETLDGRLFLS
ncbi:urease accessory protein UreF [Palleronia sp.]|uniref:urease accessory protein UreF n=1 Tax=Palleronia sp. TaxID=1940284 RepID=UPI0035C79A01